MNTLTFNFLSNYLAEKQFISTDQSAFLKHHSTQTALHKVVDDWLDAMNNGMLTGLCMFDIQKCFDTLNHEILLFKLDKYGIRGLEFEWFTSYLDCRKQLVSVNNNQSKLQSLTTGVPQGSNLGPLLFLIYINDITSYLPGCSANLYADDILIYISDKNVLSLNTALQTAVNNATFWFQINKHTPNIEKTQIMLISSNTNKDKTLNLNIKIKDSLITQKSEVTYLGVTIDSHLSWIPHIYSITKKLAPKIGALSRLSHTLPKKLLCKIFTGTIQPILEYCCTVWGQVSDNKLNKLQKYQNRAARIICNNFNFNSHGIDISRSLGWLPLRDRINYLTRNLTFKCLNSLAPNYLSDYIVMHDDISERTTRLNSQLNIMVPKPNIEQFKQSFLYQGPTLWNNLPNDVKKSNSLSQFKRLYKHHLSINSM